MMSSREGSTWSKDFPGRVEDSVEERVAAGGEHGDDVEGEEEDVVVWPTHQWYLQQSQCKPVRL